MKVLTFNEWLYEEYGRHWPEEDEDGSIWARYLAYVSFKRKIHTINFGKVK